MDGPGSPEEVLIGLDPEQRAVAESVHGPVVVLAGAGTGKTRAITHRMAYAVRSGAHDPRAGLAVTFTARAAGEVRERLLGLGVRGLQVRTFHAAAARQLRYFWPRAMSGPFPGLVAGKARLVGEAAARCRLPADPVTIRDLATEIEWAKVSEVRPEDYPTRAEAAARQPPAGLDPAEVARAYAAYEDVREERQLLDFEHLLLLTVGMLADRPDIADEVRAAYRWFTVDEFQDVNPLQHRLLDLWRGDGDELCVVGDPGQSIYGFTGATARYLLDFARVHPGATEVRLVRNYRSTPQVVGLANRLLLGAAGPPPLLLRPQGPDGPQPEVEAFDDEVAEAAGIARRVAALLATGLAAREVAVLFRVNAAAAPIEEALAEAGVPYVVRGADRFFDRPEVREAVTRLRGAARAAASGTAARPTPAGLADQVRDVLSGMGFAEQGPAGRGAARERWESLAALVALAADLAAAETADDLAGLVAELDRRAELQHAPRAEGVTLASLHAAKGLEWDAVIIAGLSEGLLPIAAADTPERVEEERRLLYVGLTRARRSLVLTWARARAPGARPARERSRFLADLAGGDIAGQVVAGSVRRGSSLPSPARVRRPPATCRVCGRSLVTAPERTLGRCRGCAVPRDDEVLERLRAWRSREARARGVMAAVVCTSATLEALAELLPADLDALAAISGIGPDRLSRYGPVLLELIAGRFPESSHRVAEKTLRGPGRLA